MSFWNPLDSLFSFILKWPQLCPTYILETNDGIVYGGMACASISNTQLYCHKLSSTYRGL